MDGIALFFQGLPFAFAALLGLVPPLIVRWVYSSFGAGAGFIALGLLQQTLLPGLGPIQLGVSLYLMDFVTLIIVTATLLRLARLPEARVHSPALLVLIAVVAVNLAQGLAVYGVGGGNAARADVYGLAALTYAMTFQGSRQQVETLVRALLWVAAALFAIACVRWIAVAFQIDAILPASGSFQPQGHSVWRVIVSNEALILAQVAVIGWFFAAAVAPLRRWRMLALPLMAAVVFLQHRSTWVAAMAAVLVAVVAARQAGGAARHWSVVGLLAFVVAVAAGLGNVGGGVSEDVEASLDSAVALQGTAHARLVGWKQLIGRWAGGGPRSWALGQPYGVSQERYADEGFGARKVSFQAHNYYVTLLTGRGLIGLAAYLALWWQVCGGLYRAARADARAPEAAILLCLLAAQAAYYLTYGTDTFQTLILGTGLAYVAARRRNAMLAQAEQAVTPPSGTLHTDLGSRA